MNNFISKVSLPDASLSKRSNADHIGVGIASFVFVVCFMIFLIVYCQRRRRRMDTKKCDDLEGIQQMRRSLGNQTMNNGNPEQQNNLSRSLNPIQSIYDFVPPYNVTADEKIDLGYYDSDWIFHSIDNIKLPSTPEKAQVRQ